MSRHRNNPILNQESVLGDIFNQPHLYFLSIFGKPEWMCRQFHSIKRFFIYKLQSSSPKDAFLGWELGARHPGPPCDIQRFAEARRWPPDVKRISPM